MIFVPNKNVISNSSFGQAINKANQKYIEPELRSRGVNNYTSAGIEIKRDGSYFVYLDNEVQIELELKNKRFKQGDAGKRVNINLHDIKNIKWADKKLDRESAKILVIHFNKDWWIWVADFKNRKHLLEEFRISQTFKIRGGGYLPLKVRRQGKSDFLEGWKAGLEKELPAMWKRHLTVSQRYRGVMVYDGNYFDLFSHAQELYVLGYFYSSIILCRTAAEQALVQILIKSGKGFEIYKQKKGKRLKSIEALTETCRSYSLFRGKYPINKTSAKKLNEISTIAGNLIHPKNDLDKLDIYKEPALKCTDNLQYLIKNHLNFVKDTGVVSGYKFSGSAKRLR